VGQRKVLDSIRLRSAHGRDYGVAVGILGELALL